MNFRPKKEHDLDRLTDDELVAYLVEARDAGHHDEARAAFAVLAHRRLPDLTRRAKLKVPAQDAEDVAMEALASALKASFDGSSVGEFVSLLNTILDRRVVDYWRSREKKPETEALPEEHAEAEDVWGKDGAVADDFTVLLDAQTVIDQLLDELSEVHRRAVELYVFQRFSAKETADEVNMQFPDLENPMTEDNVHQIAKRFRDELRGRLDESPG